MTISSDEQSAVEQFLIHEAALLDDQRFDDWFSLFDDEGLYWIPSLPGQTDPLGQASIIHEDRTVLRMRIRRLMHPRAWSLQPLPRTNHLLGNVAVRPLDNGVEATASLQVAAYRDGARTQYDGRQTMCLRRSGDDYRISQKRLDLIDCEGVHSVMAVPI